MKEIIKSGNKGIIITYYNTCPYCDCYYSYQPEDVYNNHSLTNAFNTVSCPECGMPNSTVGDSTSTWPWQNPICYYKNDNQKEQSDL